MLEDRAHFPLLKFLPCEDFTLRRFQKYLAVNGEWTVNFWLKLKHAPVCEHYVGGEARIGMPRFVRMFRKKVRPVSPLAVADKPDVVPHVRPVRRQLGD